MRQRLLSMILASAIVIPVVANEPWWCCDLCFNASAGAEAIYWKPCSNAFNYGFFADPDNDITPVRSVSVSSDYGWGFRLFGSVADECNVNGATLSWTHLRTITSNSVENPENTLLKIWNFGSTRYGGASGIKAKQRVRYHNVRLDGTRLFFSKCDSYLYAYAGGRYVYLKEERFSNSVAPEGGGSFVTASNTIPSEFNGGGLEVGIGGEVGLACGFSLTMRGGVAGLVGQRKLRIRAQSAFNNGTSITNVRFYDARTICVPGVDARVGVKYDYDCWCISMAAEIGYQIEHYFNVLAQPIPNQVTPVLSIEDIGFAGLYVGVTLSY